MYLTIYNIKGGYDESKYNEENDDLYKTIYQLDFLNKTMKPLARMITLRNHFSLVSSVDGIFIIGGENHKEGCLAKCEKLDFESN